MLSRHDALLGFSILAQDLGYIVLPSPLRVKTRCVICKLSCPYCSLERRTLKAHEMSNERSFSMKERSLLISLLIFGQR